MAEMSNMQPAAFRFRPFSVKQKQVLTWWLPESGVDHAQGIIADGAIRSGKTVVMALAFAIWSMERFRNQNFGLCGKTIGAFRRNVLTPMKAMLTARGYAYRDNRSENLLEIRRGDRINRYYLFGGKDERSQDLIQGITLAGVLFDEVALMPESFVNQATGRCSVEGAKFWFNCNPGHPAHWFKTGWIDRREEKAMLYVHFTMDDNLTLSEEVKARYRALYTGVFHKRNIKGLWVAADGAVYPQFAEDPEAFLIDTPPKIRRAVIGVDFGGTGSGHSFTLTGFTAGYRQVILLDEWYHSNKKQGVLDPEQLSRAFVDFVRRAQARYPAQEARCDSAEQTLIQGLRAACVRERVPIQIRNAVKGPINDRIALFNSLMAQGRFSVLRHCTAAIDALASAVYDSKKLGEDVRLDDGTTNIDSLDSLEYTTEPVQDRILYLKGT